MCAFIWRIWSRSRWASSSSRLTRFCSLRCSVARVRVSARVGSETACLTAGLEGGFDVDGGAHGRGFRIEQLGKRINGQQSRRWMLLADGASIGQYPRAVGKFQSDALLCGAGR